MHRDIIKSQDDLVNEFDKANKKNSEFKEFHEELKSAQIALLTEIETLLGGEVLAKDAVINLEKFRFKISKLVSEENSFKVESIRFRDDLLVTYRKLSDLNIDIKQDVDPNNSLKNVRFKQQEIFSIIKSSGVTNQKLEVALE